ncbi:hypothetical protein PLEOSDRAFT_156284 [Pleurotus ostreatus PC15]|uniref:Uncharacterized protein n=1 Tax=Pleurotus ostreatus (strain PC15) TaxID=1137138 RepID=A0A067NWM1_PLEO1|nr:hypothetical protein PLEOSDRAFT_156284 [Pleurotus ostreatus PC15]
MTAYITCITTALLTRAPVPTSTTASAPHIETTGQQDAETTGRQDNRTRLSIALDQRPRACSQNCQPSPPSDPLDPGQRKGRGSDWGPARLRARQGAEGVREDEDEDEDEDEEDVGYEKCRKAQGIGRQ